MGDFTWHLSDSDHRPVQEGRLDPPVFLLGPKGYRFHAEHYDGYGRLTGPDGAVSIGAQLARWNFPAAEVEGKDDDQLHGDAVSISLRPYGGWRGPAPKHPLKLTTDPGARYEDLAAAIPAAATAKYLSLTDFQLVLADGRALTGAAMMEALPYPEDLEVEEDEDRAEAAFEYLCDVFYDAPEEIIAPEGATLVYSGWRSSVHGLLSDGCREVRLMPLWGDSVQMLLTQHGPGTVTRLAEAFTRGLAEGAAAYDRWAQTQMSRYAAGEPLEIPQQAEPLKQIGMIISAVVVTGRGLPDLDELERLAAGEGRAVGTWHRGYALSTDFDTDAEQENIYAQAAREHAAATAREI